MKDKEILLKLVVEALEVLVRWGIEKIRAQGKNSKK